MKFAQFLAVGIAMASAAAFAGGDKRSSQTSEQQPGQSSSRDQQAQTSQGQGQGAQQEDQETVKQAQEQLSAMGHDAGPADGILGPKTQAAVKEFQESKGLQPSGQLDNQTLAALMTWRSDRAGSARYANTLAVHVDRARATCGAWYEMFPRSSTPDLSRSGTFGEAEAHVAHEPLHVQREEAGSQRGEDEEDDVLSGHVRALRVVLSRVDG